MTLGTLVCFYNEYFVIFFYIVVALVVLYSSILRNIHLLVWIGEDLECIGFSVLDYDFWLTINSSRALPSCGHPIQYFGPFNFCD